MIDTEELRLEIRHMTQQQRLYRVLRDELTALGYWRRLPRGDPRAGYAARKAKSERRGW
jgi:hypothetical protein